MLNYFILPVQRFLINLQMALITIIRVGLLSKFPVKIKPVYKGGEMVLLGNGPSFAAQYEQFRDFLNGKELMCVNHFPTTDYYEQIKPGFYIMSAPDLWLDDIDERFIKGSNRLFDAMAEKTTWNLKVFVPFESRKHRRWKEKLEKNPSVELVYYNNIPVEGWAKFRHLLFRWNLGMPRPHNVMIPGITVALNLGFKKIYLWGADHSWLQDITVDADNRVLLNQKHFYDHNTSKALPLDKRGKGERRLHEILHKFMNAFAGYFVLRTYADSLGADIINTTEGSYIDAFERLTLEKQKD